jgi:DNA-binding NtrC family response regulator
MNESWEAAVATILLVDDEKIVRTLLAVALRRQNHTVLEASTGRRALTAIHKQKSHPDLLIAELSLPHMSAIELAGELTLEFSKLKVLLLSRSPHPVKLAQRAAGDGHTVLREPFDFSTIVGQVAQLLDVPQTRKPAARSKSNAAGKQSASKPL